VFFLAANGVIAVATVLYFDLICWTDTNKDWFVGLYSRGFLGSIAAEPELWPAGPDADCHQIV
jgi:hypothetical protein